VLSDGVLDDGIDHGKAGGLPLRRACRSAVALTGGFPRRGPRHQSYRETQGTGKNLHGLKDSKGTVPQSELPGFGAAFRGTILRTRETLIQCNLSSRP